MTKTNLFVFFAYFFLLNTPEVARARFSPVEKPSGAIYSDTLGAIHYGIHLTNINLTAKTIQGYTEAELVCKHNSLSGIKLELASLKVDSVFIRNSRTNAFVQKGDQLLIALPAPAFKGDTLYTTIYYHGEPFTDQSGWGGFHFSGDYALNLGVGFNSIPHNLGKAWFPCIDDFHDRALYDVYLTVDNDKKAISGGLLIGVKDNRNNTSTWHWKTMHTLPAYLISLTTGKYKLRTDTFNGQKAIIPITYYCQPEDTSKVAGTFINLKNIARVFESHFGPYPFERIGYTGTPESLGAMEHACNISYPFSGWTGSADHEWWYAHELAHMWFGDMVTCASAEDMWLNEGWAVWSESLYREGIYGKQAYKQNMRAKLKDVLEMTHIEDGEYYAVSGIPQTITYGNTVYQKGGQVAHTLRGYMGDSLFFGGIKAYLQKYAYNFASSTDLRDFLSIYCGIDLKPFFDAWVFEPGFPHFSVDSVITEKLSKHYDVTVFIRQRLKGRSHYANANHLEITFLDKNWQKITDTIVFSGPAAHKTFHLSFAPVSVMCDINEKISDATTDEVKILKNTGEYNYESSLCKVLVNKVSDSALVRIILNWVAPDSAGDAPKGLRLSDSRFWTVGGIFPKGFKAGGKFIYDRKAGLDNSLISKEGDSLIILYRTGAGHDWQATAFTQQGSWSSGILSVESLKQGEYTLAVWDRKFLQKAGK